MTKFPPVPDGAEADPRGPTRREAVSVLAAASSLTVSSSALAETTGHMADDPDLKISDLSFPEAEESPHKPGPGPLWHESSWVYFGNAADLGGCVHIGQEVNEGHSYVWASGYKKGVAFRRMREDYPLNSEARAAGIMAAGPYSVSTHRGKTIVKADEDGFKLDLEFEDMLPYPALLPVFRGASESAKRISSNSYQTPCRVRGTMQLAGEVASVAGWAQRGHSWGDRNHVELRGHGSRWITGSIGPDLSFSAYTAIRMDGSLVRAGYVVDKGHVFYAKTVEVDVTVDVDGITYKSGAVRMIMPSGRVYTFECTFDNVNFFEHHQVNIVVTGGKLRIVGNPSPGYCAWEIKDRPPSPYGTPPFSLGAFTVDGVHTER